MKIFLFADNWVGYQVVKYLHSQHEEIVGIAIHPPKRQNFSNEIIKHSHLANEKIFIVGKKPDSSFVDILRKFEPDIILVVFWTYLLPKSIYSIPKFGCVNFHMSYLPFNRGKKPNVWPIIEGTPAGVSLHYVNDGIDSGNILLRKKVKIDITDTAESLYKKQLTSFVRLFKENWLKIKNGNIHPIKNEIEEGTFHLDKDFKRLDEIDLSEKYYPLELINHLRAKTFSPHSGAYFVHKGKKVFIRIELEYGD